MSLHYFSMNLLSSTFRGKLSCKNFLAAPWSSTAQKMKFSIKDFISKCDQIRSFLRIWSHLLTKYASKTWKPSVLNSQGLISLSISYGKPCSSRFLVRLWKFLFDYDFFKKSAGVSFYWMYSNKNTLFYKNKLCKNNDAQTGEKVWTN